MSSVNAIDDKKAGRKSGYDFEAVEKGTKKREEVAYASLPNLLNGSLNPSQGTQTTQTAFNA